MTEDIKVLLQERKQVELVDCIFLNLKENQNHFDIKNIILEFKKDLDNSIELDVEYDDYLDDIIAAMEGWCSNDFKLHPKNFKKDL